MAPRVFRIDRDKSWIGPEMWFDGMDASLRWPCWRVDMSPEDLLMDLYQQYNTVTIPLQDLPSFHADVSAMAALSDSREQFLSRLAERAAERRAELTKAMRKMAPNFILAEMAQLSECCCLGGGSSSRSDCDRHLHSEKHRRCLQERVHAANHLLNGNSVESLVCYFAMLDECDALSNKDPGWWKRRVGGGEKHDGGEGGKREEDLAAAACAEGNGAMSTTTPEPSSASNTFSACDAQGNDESPTTTDPPDTTPQKSSSEKSSSSLPRERVPQSSTLEPGARLRPPRRDEKSDGHDGHAPDMPGWQAARRCRSVSAPPELGTVGGPRRSATRPSLPLPNSTQDLASWSKRENAADAAADDEKGTTEGCRQGKSGEVGDGLRPRKRTKLS